MLKRSRLVKLSLGSMLCEIGKPIQQVYFPLEGFISQIVTNHDGLVLQIGLLGNEGVLGATLLLGEKDAPISALVQSEGTALAMSPEQMCRALCQNPTLLRILNRYLFTMTQQWAQAAFCAHFHKTKARLARFLLMAHDRSHKKTFNLTQDTLSKLLGVRRSSITVTASALQRDHLIQYCRGEIDIIDRKKLSATACSCYAHNKQ